jgi:hypothetical protein
MPGRITFTGKELTKKSSSESIHSLKKSRATPLKASENQSRLSKPFPVTGHDASMKNIESFIRLFLMPFILHSFDTTIKPSCPVRGVMPARGRPGHHEPVDFVDFKKKLPFGSRDMKIGKLDAELIFGLNRKL